MSSDFDKMVEELTQEIWAGFSPVVIDHAQNPRNAGSIQDADAFGSVTGPCGDNIEIWLKVQDNVIKKATFWTDGCGTTIAAGSMITEIAKDKSIDEAMRITQQDVLDALGGLPEDSVHCALLAANTLKKTIENYLAKTSSSSC